MTDPSLTPEQQQRQRWMYTLAHADIDELQAFEQQLKQAAYSLIRPPETGMALVRARMGGTGRAYNQGEMTVTRCVVRTAEGCTGYSYIAGRNGRHAELAALADAHLQGEARTHWLAALIEPLEQQRKTRLAAREAEHAGTRVDFFTLARGEDNA